MTTRASVRFVARQPENNDATGLLYNVYESNGTRLGTAKHLRRGLWQVESVDGTFMTYATNKSAAGWALRHEYGNAHPTGEVSS